MHTGIQHQYAAQKVPAWDPEPRFDSDRVVWDAYYRRQVIDRLRNWRQRQHHTGRSSGASANAA